MSVEIPQHVEQLLQESTVARVATVFGSGAPHVAPFWFFFDGERIYLDTVENQTVRNLRRDPRVSVVVDTGSSFAELRGAIVAGTAVAHEESSAPTRLLNGIGAIRAAHADEIATPLFASYLERERRPVVLVEIEPRAVSSWDLARSAR